MIYDHFIDRLKDRWDETMDGGTSSKDNCFAFFERYYRVMSKAIVLCERKLEQMEVGQQGLPPDVRSKLRECRTDLRNAIWFSAFDRPKPSKKYRIKSLFDGLINWKQVYEHHHFFDDEPTGKVSDVNERRRQTS